MGEMKRLLLVTVTGGLLLTGCASSRSVLYKGVSSPLGTTTTVVTDAAAVRDGRSARADWVAMVRRGQAGASGIRFSHLSDREFRSRLAAAAARYGFTVRAVRFLHPRQVTPLVLVQTSRYVAFARAVPAIESSLDPHKGGNDSKGWSYRAFYLEALDERGVPFLVVDNVVDGTGVTGGQWARSDALFPFARI